MPSSTIGPPVAAGLPVVGDADGSEPRVIMIGLADLHEHPQQRDLFDDLPASEFAALVEDLRRNGQTTPIRILVDGTILGGTQRVRGASWAGSGSRRSLWRLKTTMKRSRY